MTRPIQHSKQSTKKASIIFSLILIGVGSGWLLTVKDVLPGVNWVWIVMLGGAGLLPLAIWGLDRVTFVVAMFFILTSFASILRQTGRLDVDTEVPCLVIASGVILLLGRLLPLALPKWLQEAQGVTGSGGDAGQPGALDRLKEARRQGTSP